MPRLLVIALLALASACGSSALERRVAELERENAELRRAESRAAQLERRAAELERETAELRRARTSDPRRPGPDEAALRLALGESSATIDVRVSRILVLPAPTLFERESIDLSETGAVLVDRIAPHLPRGHRLLVTGHRGPRAFGTDEYPELHRATVVARRLHSRISQLNLSAAALADHMPRSPDEVPVGQTPNDRVEIYLEEIAAGSSPQNE